ncbi:hypothetical protein [Vibrio atlanticus]|uniref:hypothetical protein n=1 Tax=Vibrio atlanticus TaxID=693153 RepID=UPI003D106985
MARISREQREQNFTHYNEIILQIFLNEGWEHITYDRLSKETGLRKSTLQGYYPTNQHFEVAIRGKIFPIIIHHLNLSDKSALIGSWKEAMQDTQFRMVMRMFVMQSYKVGGDGSSRLGVIKLGQLLAHHIPNHDPLTLIRELFGLTVTELLDINDIPTTPSE